MSKKRKTLSSPTGAPQQTSNPGTIRTIPISSLRRDDGTQTRAAINQEAVDEYAELMASDGGNPLPPIVVFQEAEDTYVLADGFHRVEAAMKAGRSDIVANVRKGSQLDALMHSLQANRSYGVRRTNADKRQSVKLVLAEETLRGDGDSYLADLCGVSNHLVAEVRAALEANVRTQVGESPTSTAPEKRKGKDGKRYPAKQRRVDEPSANDAGEGTKNGEEGVPSLEILGAVQHPAEVQNTGVALSADTKPADGSNDGGRGQSESSSGSNDEELAVLPGAGMESGETVVLPEMPQDSVTGDGSPLEDTQWEDGILSSASLRTRLKLVATTYPGDRYTEAERQAFRDCFTELQRTINRTSALVCASRLVRKRVAVDAAIAMGKHLSTSPFIGD